MPILSDPQIEQFCHALAVLKLNKANAIRRAGYEHTQPGNKAWQLMNKPEVKARLAELNYREEAKAQGPEAIALADDAAAVVEDKRSLEYLLAEHQRNLTISKAKQDTREARATLIEIGKLGGYYVERSEVTTKADPLAGLSADQLAAFLRVISAQRMALHASAVPVAMITAPEGPDGV